MAISNHEYIIRPASLSETAEIIVEWAANEGWNPGLYDADCFYKTDPNGFFVGCIDDVPVSCISLVKYNPDFAFLGFYIVHPDFRGKGYGLKIWEAAMKFAGTANIGLDGVVDQQENYKKSGFRLACRNIRYQGESRKYPHNSNNIEPISQNNIEMVLQYDVPLFPANRALFLRNWLSLPESFAFAYIAQDKVRGYIVLRKCRTGYKIGPLFADSPDIAENLLFHTLYQLPAGTVFFIDIPEVNPDALRIIQKTSLQKVFETARMYTDSFPRLDISKIYGVTSFELG
ncbi:MAG: GNAT family N-acetyltransferase [Lentimicrobium sp.]|nr:GNAT family N-acetyltransferase [Lentimicrobium sp.]